MARFYGPLRQPVMADDELKSLRVSTDSIQGSRSVEAFLEIWAAKFSAWR
jgi:hypothetical protein